MGKTTAVLSMCLLALAEAQFTSRYQNNFGSQSQTSFTNQRQGFGSSFQQPQSQQYQQQQYKQQQYQQPQYQQQQYQQPQYQQQQYQQPQYQQQQYQQKSYQQGQASSGSCREKNERYPVSGSCDRYIECLNGVSEEKTCPDGLRFSGNLTFDRYPCLYPNEVPCLERSALQPAQPTDECPHQYGYFKLGDARNCSAFRTCVAGRAYDLLCPEGLAFNSETYQCDWPDLVSDCDAEAFLGFRCPNIPTTKELGEPAGYRFYRSADDCQKYFICIDGRPRGLRCGGASGFDELTSTCLSADEVDACPQELRAAAARSRDEEQQRLARKLAEDSNKSRRY